MAGHSAFCSTDPLTGLADSGALLAQAQLLFDREEQSISLLAFDVDQLKRVNETFGHATGDRVLRIFAYSLSKALGPACIAGRSGGDEFVAILPGCGIKTAFAVADQVRARFADEAHLLDTDCVGATVSVGVATATRYKAGFADTLFSANRALDRAKALGCDRVASLRDVD